MTSIPQEIEAQLSIRPAFPEEMDEVHMLQESLLEQGGHKNRSQMVGGGVLLVAILADRIVGTGHVYKRPDEDHAHIGCVAVDSDHQGHNIGSEILSHLEEIALEDGAHATELTTTDAEGFYQRNGYVNLGRISTRVGLQTHMAKRLVPAVGRKGNV